MDPTNDLLIRLASSLKEEDLINNPEMEAQIRQLVVNLSNSNDLPPDAISQLMEIKDKSERFMAAMQLMRVTPDPKLMAKLAEAMQNAGLLNAGQISDSQEKEEPEDEEINPGPEEDDFHDQMEQEGQDSEEVPMTEQEAAEPEIKERTKK